MKRGLAPAGAVFMALTISLAILGVGYGLWSDTLRVSGAVNTGSVNAAFSLHELDEGLRRGAAGGPADNNVNEDKEASGIDTAECYVRIAAAASDAPLAANDSVDEISTSLASDLLFVLIRNGYPSFNCYVDFDVHNVGSIPIKVQKPVLSPFDARALTVEFENCYDSGVEVPPGKEVLCTLHVHVERGAQPNSWYRFGATICAWQWNADGPVRCLAPVEVEPVPADLIDSAKPLPLTPARDSQ